MPEGAEGIAYDVPMDKQDSGYTCGAASGAMALAARGLNVSEWDVAAKAETNASEGTYVYKLVNALNYFIGSNVYRYTDTMSYSTSQFYNTLISSLSVVCMPIERLTTKNYQYIFGYNSGGHYVCCVGAYTLDGKMYAKINDPATGKIFSMEAADFHQAAKDKGDGAYLIHGG